MKLREHKGLILIIIGILLSMTLYLIFFGIPLIILGTYYLNKKVNQREKEINEKLNYKKAELANIDNKLNEMEKEKERKINIKLKEKETELAKIDNRLKQGKKRLISVEDELEIQEAGLYEPKYDFLTAVSFKEKLDEIRKKQKELIKNKKAAICGTEWAIDGNRRKGIAFSNAQIKQILKNFNLEC